MTPRSIWGCGCLLLVLALAGTGCRPVPASRSTFAAIIGGPGHTSGRFNRPRGLDYDAARDSLFVVDWDGRVQKFTGNGQFRASWVMPDLDKGKPEAVCIRPNGNLLVADTHYSRIVEFSPTGDLLKTFGSYGTAPGQFIYPVAVCVDPEDRIYVSEYGGEDRIQQFSPDGRPLQAWGRPGEAPGQFQRPSGLTINSRRELFVADAVNHRVQVFDLDGHLLRVFGRQGRGPGELTYPYDVAARGEYVYVLEYGNQRVQKFTRTGKLVGSWGRGGTNDGEFAGPWKLATAREGLYVSDTNNSRVVNITF